MKFCEQQYSSKDTSTNVLARVFTAFEFGNVNYIFDYGCGKYNTNSDYVLSKYGIKLCKYDKYNRSEKENADAFAYAYKNKPDVITLSNVLNVIEEENVRIEIINNIKEIMHNESILIVTTYQRRDVKHSCVTSKGYQLNRSTKQYAEFLKSFFPYVGIKKNVIVCGGESFEKSCEKFLCTQIKCI